MEAIACGTPVLAFRTGGSPEIADDRRGYVVDVDDIEELKRQIIRICTEKVFSKNKCIERAQAFDRKVKFEEYLTLFDEVVFADFDQKNMRNISQYIDNGLDFAKPKTIN